MFWICKECGWENEYSEESKLSPCGCCGAPAPAKLEPAGANFYQKAYLLLKDVEYGDADAKTEAIDRAIHYLKEQGIGEEQARLVVSVQAEMLGWEETVAPQLRKEMFGESPSDGDQKTKEKIPPEKEKKPGNILSRWKEMPVRNRATFFLGLFSVVVLGSGFFLSLPYFTDLTGRVVPAISLLWIVLMLSNLVHLWKDGFSFPGILGTLCHEDTVLSFVLSMLAPILNLAIYLGGPFATLLLLIDVTWVHFLGVLVGLVFGGIWTHQRIGAYA